MKSTHSILTKMIAMFLSILLVFYVLPISAIAEEINNSSSASQSNAAEEQGSNNNDSTTQKPYTYYNEVYEETSFREESVKHFRLEDGSFVAAQYSSPVHYLDENGEWQNIDNSLAESGSEFTTSDARVKFIKKTTGNGNIFTLHDGNTKITLSLAGANKKVNGIVTNTEESETTEIGKLMSLEGLSSRIRYNDILAGVDIEYVLDSLSIKENIIIKEKKDAYAYTFTLSLNGLEAELLANGDISITKNGEQKYTIPAPVVFDSADITAPADAASYSLTDNGNGKYTLTVSVSTEWMNASDRVYPVTLDPAIIKENWGILDTYGTPGTSSDGFSSATLNISDDIALIKIRTLPALPAGAKISAATLKMFRTSGTGGYIGAYLVNEGWDTAPLNVAALTYGVISDYAYTKANEDGTYGIDGEGAFVWNITKIVESWYNGTENNGIALKRMSGSGTTVFASVQNSVASLRPSFSISYVNTLGLEDYYSYSTQGGGAAGTGYVNYATGDLTFDIGTLTSTDYIMPVTPTLVYNSALANSKYTSSTVNTIYTTSCMPKGFKLNLQETIVKRSYISNSGAVSYYIWADGDGTEHFFYPTDTANIYCDDSGLLLELDLTSSTNPTITDINKNVRTFTKYDDSINGWRLSEISVKVGNKLRMTYDSNGWVTSLSLRPNGSSSDIAMLSLQYSNGRLYRVTHVASGDAVTLKYSDTYNGDITDSAKEYLRQIEYTHVENNSSGTNVTISDAIMYYEYDANGYLISAKNGLADYTVNYEWTDGKVTSIYEKGGTTQGMKLGFVYGIGYTEVTTPGGDGAYSSTRDNLINHYTYDKFFRITSQYSTSYDRSVIYGASFGKYTSDEEDSGYLNKNRIQESTVSNGISSNYITNGSFLITSDSDSVPYWEISHDTVYIALDGRNAELCIPYSAGQTYTVYQYVYLPVADKYTFAFDIETYDTNNIIIEADVLSDGTSLLNDNRVNADKIDETLQRYTYSKTFEINAATVVKVQLKVRQIPGAAIATHPLVYIANVRMEQGIGSSSFNYVNMGDFVDTYYTASGNPTDVTLDTMWYDENGTSYVTSAAYPFKNTLKINGGLYNRYIKQTFYTAPQAFIHGYSGSDWLSNAGATYTVSGFARTTEGAISNSRGKFALRVDVYYYQGEGIDDIVISHYFDFNPDITDWQYVSGTFTTKYVPDEYVPGEFYDVVRKIDVVCEFKYQPSGAAYFDKIAVVEDLSGTTHYTYNDQGRLVITETRNETSYREYDADGNLTRVANDSGDICDYSYNSNGMLISESHYSFTTKEGVFRYKYPYGAENPDEQINKTRISNTTYSYNAYGLVTDIVTTGASSDSVSVKTHNTYITTSGSAIFGALQTTSDGAGKTLKYFYDTKRGYLLAEINVGDKVGTAYTYDAVGNITKVQAAFYNATTGTYYVSSDSATITYAYNNKKELTSITTASTTYSFVYDAFGRMSRYENDDIRYYYNPDGKLYSIAYGLGDFEYNYYYDDLGRLEEEICAFWVTGEIEINGEIYCDDFVEITIKKYEYTADGKLYRIYDALNDEYTHYSYDVGGRLEHVIRYKSDKLNEFSVNYYYSTIVGKEYLVSSQSYFFNYAVGSNSEYGHIWLFYDYNDDDSFESLRLLSGGEDIDVIYTYDSFKRPSKTTVTNGSFTNETSYGYKVANGVTTGEISTYTSKVGNVTNTYTYTYDARGNICSIELNGELQYEFYYDNLGQLVYEENYITGECCSYEYDDAGNIVLRIDGIELAEYHYVYAPSPYGDRLVSYNGETISYDQYGRTVVYRDKDITYYTLDFNRIQSIGNVSFTYDGDSMRRSKTVNGVTHTYYYDGIRPVSEEWGNNIMIFLYDALGSPVGMQYRNSNYAEGDWDTYYYEKNLQGDIVAIYNSTGTKLVSYDYDAWGDMSYVSYFNGGANTSARYNPLRYRGYYYDDDLDLYYLATRYYDPEVCRFITADSYVSTGQGILGHNMYAYCNNNPVNYVDRAGEISIAVAALILLVAELFLILTSSESDVIDGMQGLTDAADMGLAVNEFGQSTQVHNEYIREYSDAVILYNNSEEILWNDTLAEAFGNQKYPYDSYKESLEFDAPYLKLLYPDDLRTNDVDFLSDNFSTWAASAKGKIGSKAGAGVISKGYNLLEKILDLFK